MRQNATPFYLRGQEVQKRLSSQYGQVIWHKRAGISEKQHNRLMYSELCRQKCMQSRRLKDRQSFWICHFVCSFCRFETKKCEKKANHVAVNLQKQRAVNCSRGCFSSSQWLC